MTDHNPHFVQDPQPFDWRAWFSRQRATEETKYQAYKQRFMDELDIQERETPEDRAVWKAQMVKK